MFGQHRGIAKFVERLHDGLFARHAGRDQALEALVEVVAQFVGDLFALALVSLRQRASSLR